MLRKEDEMRKPIMAALVMAGLASVAPAMAQEHYGRSWNHDHRYGSVDYRGVDNRAQCATNRARPLYFRIRRSVEEHNMSWQRGQDLRGAVERTAEMQRNFCARGLNDYRAERLDRQWDQVEDMVNREARG
jgi:hypothetical protein